MSYVKQLRAGVVFVDEIPRLSTGKLDRKYFKQLVSNEVIKNDSKIFIQ
jgi:acyl-coenzyme A synthetase/AMP-(fatty) acid ligase